MDYDQMAEDMRSNLKHELKKFIFSNKINSQGS